uniref:Uncharacterized protein n=1 Tax=Vitrella brassicaformis TaxID=1169539 RepID=A0A7S1KFR0_9ALVE|mmetsp:Transcript_52323/g.131526  ORF Transcript_52323/g.131526 Transcript_52323/m.131526 type:complete len:176 (+) Transcript_52323:152-679(+)
MRERPTPHPPQYVDCLTAGGCSERECVCDTLHYFPLTPSLPPSLPWPERTREAGVCDFCAVGRSVLFSTAAHHAIHPRDAPMHPSTYPPLPLTAMSKGVHVVCVRVGVVCVMHVWLAVFVSPSGGCAVPLPGLGSCRSVGQFIESAGWLWLWLTAWVVGGAAERARERAGYVSQV